MRPRKILMDCDPGVDDALALLLALSSPEAQVLAVTTVAGNAPVEVCTRNALRVLAVAAPLGARRVRPPVYQGASGPLAGIEGERASHIHGEDGLGDVDPRRYPDPPESPVPPPAPEALLRWARRSPGELTLVATGPLTNVAIAAQADPEGARLFRRIVVMGGAVRAPGNVTPGAEFNAWSDPEALEVLLAQDLPLILVPLDVTRQVVLTKRHLDRLPRDDPRARLVRDCTRAYMDFHRKARGIDGCFLHDPLALGVALDPSFVRMEEMYLQVVTGTGRERGRTREAPSRRGGGPGGRVRVCTAVEAERFLDFFLSRLGG
ncbi:MAG: nucleoside hydrolase [Candidatus Tectomicrobia bacterium]|nr:nucleoside hydrolase [Candidatus Tectomicrobia bacterium]